MAERRQISLSVPSGDERPTVALCAGKDCRKRCEFAKVRSALTRQCDVVELKCIGLCSGPVVVTDITSDTPMVYSRLRSKRDRRRLVAAATGDIAAATSLEERRVRKKKVLVSAARRIDRLLA